MILKSALAFAAATLLMTGVAQAQTCGGGQAQAGTEVRGPVLMVLDGQRLCVATGAERSQWSELLIRGADEGPVPVSGALGSALLMSVAFGQDADCRVGADGIADCRVGGQPLTSLLRRPGALRTAQAWVRKPAAEARVLLASR